MIFFGKWLRFQNKRLYKTPVFLALLLTIPLFTLTVSLFSEEESGFFRIQLAGVREGTLSAQIADSLREDSELLLFSVAGSEDAAKDAVRSGKADAAWIFPEDLEGALERFVLSNYTSPPAVTVFVREHTVPMRLSEEKLAGALYETCGKALFLSYLRGVLPEDAALSDGALLQFYDGYTEKTPLFVFETLHPDGQGNSADGSSSASPVDYLLAPVRGFLSVLIAIAGLASAIFVLRDEEKGAYGLLSPGKRPLAGFLINLLAALNTGVASLVALCLSHVAISLPRELAAMAVYCLCCALFGMLFAKLIPNPSVLSTLLPLLAVCMIGICPIFFSVKALAPVAALFPPTWYLRSFSAENGLLSLAVYTVCVGAFATALSLLRLHRGRLPFSLRSK